MILDRTDLAFKISVCPQLGTHSSVKKKVLSNIAFRKKKKSVLFAMNCSVLRWIEARTVEGRNFSGLSFCGQVKEKERKKKPAVCDITRFLSFFFLWSSFFSLSSARAFCAKNKVASSVANRIRAVVPLGFAIVNRNWTGVNLTFWLTLMFFYLCM